MYKNNIFVVYIIEYAENFFNRLHGLGQNNYWETVG